MDDGKPERAGEVVALFRTTFAASEGEDEGRAIADLARSVLDAAEADGLRVFTRIREGCVIAAVFFSPLVYPHDARRTVLLSPMAVHPQHQRKGAGQSLIAEALARLRTDGIDVVVTYGDPAFYGKVGFQPVSEAVVPPPMPLSHPDGWLALALDGGAVPCLQGSSQCIPALRKPEYW
ncbi:GNAT family N-acetyltransferase [Stappia sp. ES.058]|uniref:GNAT family N-acetyltransferase n=1 Tax=Stappia sp. ES.058 TaxID=1881061 RepID=UPI00087B7972|nr:N-acetyltransferase [Stappia sp. ES.058]SDT92322.1 Predicted N-acetyltransferase YhbS [Stappia sp. ES.058]